MGRGSTPAMSFLTASASASPAASTTIGPFSPAKTVMRPLKPALMTDTRGVSLSILTGGWAGGSAPLTEVDAKRAIAISRCFIMALLYGRIPGGATPSRGPDHRTPEQLDPNEEQARLGTEGSTGELGWPDDF